MFRNSRRLRLVLALLILTSFTLITIDYRSGHGSALDRLRGAAAAVFGPVQRAVTSVVRPIGNALSTVGELGSIRSERDRLKRENAQLREQSHEADDVRRQNDELRKILALAGRGRYRIVASRVIGEPASPFESTVTIDVGSKDGVRKGQTVVNGDGLVGRIISVAPYSSDVLLANDPTFKVAARMAISGEFGSLAGDGGDPMTLQLLNADAKVAKNEPVVTKGLSIAGGIVPGVPIGLATSSQRLRGLTRTVLVQPFVSFTTLDQLAVIIEPPRVDPRNGVLPTPPPTPTPTPSPTPAGSGSPSPGVSGPPPPSTSASPTR